MNLETLMFYLLSALTVFAALRVITSRNPVHAALFLVLAFFSTAGIWMLLEAEFLALTLVLVYVGAVMVLFLFVVMMLDINLERLRVGFWKWFPFAAILAVVLLVEMVMVLGSSSTAGTNVNVAKHAADYSNTKELGRLIYTEYIYAFELAAVLLLVAIIAAIALTLRQRSGTKHQVQGDQIQVRSKDRVRIVSMPSVARPDTRK
ncbi:MAG: NADH:ubiquinone oxidoreductase subunit J [Gallionellales bacterium 35-53-114]|jgi:NADH-quinone oxidoreductase subunit J|nr:MAG: NADH:ubiquinone oxidoreductase subunit J [Gallionellales bacterium 35-53-114]OYZ62878.1 MAG: NADH:ubiquinone oxidoreductase subunit J [Gallionellales bacterium 24-53-125]OZB09954.1 MAG: NADH:ubiquinone oxidoreductase subunit J [Gallionellales bacterium 39-52-133]HQS58374.1 NADH-quinone oxidoreductase subunit J [Gallionellaceae bacterium]HQS73929.1 NADH-quinone oxidoreductase subunit J [Gallionellaceae bacterium]